MADISEFLKHCYNPAIIDMFSKANRYINNHFNVVVSISGGSDSDIVMDIVEKVRDPEVKVTYVFFDTGVEYQATKRQLDYLEERYGVRIERERAEKVIPLCIKDYGVPFMSKLISKYVEQGQIHGFDWDYNKTEEQVTKEVGKTFAKWWCNVGTFRSYRIDYYPGLKAFLSENPPDYKISASCCHYAKKNTANKFRKRMNADLEVYGVRKAEGGIRSGAYKSCYGESENGIDRYRPIWWFTDDDKREYEQMFEIHHSDCYTKYGLKRTGCVGCPFGRDVLGELDAIKENEPKLYNACMHMFGKSYEYKRKLLEFRQRLKNKDQISLFDIED